MDDIIHQLVVDSETTNAEFQREGTALDQWRKRNYLSQAPSSRRPAAVQQVQQVHASQDGVVHRKPLGIWISAQ